MRISRRELLAAAATFAPPPAVKSRVAIARDTTPPDSARLLKLLDRTIQAVYDRDTPAEAWKQVARRGEVIGLKVNCLAGTGASTHPVLVETICERLQQSGIPARDILIWDRLNPDLESAGFRIEERRGRIRCLGNDVLGYEDDLVSWGSAASLPARALGLCDAVINLPVLKDHGITGVTMALKNLFGAIHNPNKYHGNTGDPYVADVNMLPPIRRKVRLTICDAITAQYEGGPSYMPQWSWRFNGLIASRDPVALDYIGWRILERKRAENGFPTLRAAKREPTYIATAAARGLGTNNPASIERVDV